MNQRMIVLSAILTLLFIAVPTTVYAGVSFGTEIQVDRGETADDAVTFGEDIIVRGTIKGDAVSFGGDIKVESGGEITGDVVSFGGDVTVRQAARVGGDVVCIGGEADVRDGAVIAGVIENPDGVGNVLIPVLLFGPLSGLITTITITGIIGGFITRLIVWGGIAALITHFFPAQVVVLADSVRTRFWLGLLAGFVFLLLLPVMAVLLLITLIGIPFIPLLMLAAALLGLIGSTGLALMVSRLIVDAGNRHIITNVVIGVVILSVIQSIPVLGILANFIIACISIGVVLLTRAGRTSLNGPVFTTSS